MADHDVLRAIARDLGDMDCSDMEEVHKVVDLASNALNGLASEMEEAQGEQVIPLVDPETDRLRLLARKWNVRACALRAAIDTVLDSSHGSRVIEWSRQMHGPFDGPWTDDPPEEAALLREAWDTAGGNSMSSDNDGAPSEGGG